MPDISMCADDRCPSRTRCYRHADSGTVPSEFRQAYGYFGDARCGETQCWAFLPTRDDEGVEG